MPQRTASDPVRSAAVRLAASRGWAAVTPEAVAAAAGVPATDVLGRWPDQVLLAAEVVDLVTLLPVPADHGSLTADLAAVVDGLGLPLSPEEGAVAALLGDPAWSPALSGVVVSALDRAPRVLVEELVCRARARGESAAVAARAPRTLRALLARRLATGPLSALEAEHLVEGVLLPALRDPRLTRV